MDKKSQFIGEKEISAVTVSKETTPLGAAIVEVTFIDGSKETLTEKTFKNSVTDEAVDLSTLRELRVIPLVKEVLVLFRESNIKIEEVDFFSQILVQSVNNNSSQASSKLWGVNYEGEVTFLMQDNVLKDNNGTGK